MNKVKTSDIDRFIINRKRRFNGEDALETEKEIRDFGLGFTVLIPNVFKESSGAEVSEIFFSENRPPIVLTAAEKHAGITFQALADSGLPEPSEMGMRIRTRLDEIDSRMVFYESGSAGVNQDIQWMEYKSFAADERVYNLLFLFRAAHRMVMGSFYCIYKDYDTWKPLVLRMLDTIHTGG